MTELTTAELDTDLHQPRPNDDEPRDVYLHTWDLIRALRNDDHVLAIVQGHADDADYAFAALPVDEEPLRAPGTVTVIPADRVIAETPRTTATILALEHDHGLDAVERELIPAIRDTVTDANPRTWNIKTYTTYGVYSDPDQEASE